MRHHDLAFLPRSLAAHLSDRRERLFQLAQRADAEREARLTARAGADAAPPAPEVSRG